jgi:Flp pilus assembly protein TadB
LYTANKESPIKSSNNHQTKCKKIQGRLDRYPSPHFLLLSELLSLLVVMVVLVMVMVVVVVVMMMVVVVVVVMMMVVVVVVVMMMVAVVFVSKRIICNKRTRCKKHC